MACESTRREREKERAEKAKTKRRVEHRFSSHLSYLSFLSLPPLQPSLTKRKQQTPGRATTSAPSSWSRTWPTPSRYERAREREEKR